MSMSSPASPPQSESSRSKAGVCASSSIGLRCANIAAGEFAGTVMGTVVPSENRANRVEVAAATGVLGRGDPSEVARKTFGSAERALVFPLSFFDLEGFRSGPGPGFDSMSPSLVRSLFQADSVGGNPFSCG